ncbi:hypothetical protein [Synechocystis sp. PCC 7509]|uniref:hypothetical protein n=1 Tax=Synechocystis sp. PCC 7509 TaxID=927677 RepID=UPI0002AC025A|nr:hypothetical protein [Synechocystis sp. PCC 7509]
MANWKSGTAALMALAITTGISAPIFTTQSASAQLFPTSPRSTTPSQITIPSGTTIPVRYDKAEKIVVSPKETMAVTLTVASNIVNRSGTILIPAGSTVEGELQPATNGSQFIARTLITNNRRQSIDASSQVISQTSVNSRSKVGNILKGAAIGAAASAALGALTGDRAIATEEILLGTGAGALGGALLRNRKADVVVIEPDTDLAITLNSNLALR